MNVGADCLRQDRDERQRDLFEHAGAVENAEEHRGSEDDSTHGQGGWCVAAQHIALVFERWEVQRKQGSSADEEGRCR